MGEKINERTRISCEQWLSPSQPWKIDLDFYGWDKWEQPLPLTEEDFNAIEQSLRGKYSIEWSDSDIGRSITVFAEDADPEQFDAIIKKLGKHGRGHFVVDTHWNWEIAKLEETMQA